MRVKRRAVLMCRRSESDFFGKPLVLTFLCFELGRRRDRKAERPVVPGRQGGAGLRAPTAHLQTETATSREVAGIHQGELLKKKWLLTETKVESVSVALA